MGPLVQIVRVSGAGLVALSCTASAVSDGGAGGMGSTASATTEVSASTGMPAPCDGKVAGDDCAPKACVDGVELGVSRCDAAAQCLPSDMRSCGYYACARDMPACLVSCQSSSDCAPGAFCKNEACQPGHPSGAACATQDECASRNCVDGVCCETRCDGACEACSAAKKGAGDDGVCGMVAVDTDPDEECTAQAATTCGRSGTCNGTGACSLHPAATPCGGQQCVGAEMLQAVGACDGSGACVAGPISVCPNNLACDPAANACFGSCDGVNERCAPGYACGFDGSGFFCVAV